MLCTYRSIGIRPAGFRNNDPSILLEQSLIYTGRAPTHAAVSLQYVRISLPTVETRLEESYLGALQLVTCMSQLKYSLVGVCRQRTPSCSRFKILALGQSFSLSLMTSGEI